MTIYLDDPIEEQYAYGRNRGYSMGEDALADGAGVLHDDLIGIRGMVDSALDRESRAYYLGYLRGYREAVRTFKNGRWGT